MVLLHKKPASQWGSMQWVTSSRRMVQRALQALAVQPSRNWHWVSPGGSPALGTWFLGGRAAQKAAKWPGARSPQLACVVLIAMGKI